MFPSIGKTSECQIVDTIDVSTANELFDAAIVCDDLENAVGMMIIAQIRAISDLQHFHLKQRQTKKALQIYIAVFTVT